MLKKGEMVICITFPVRAAILSLRMCVNCLGMYYLKLI